MSESNRSQDSWNLSKYDDHCADEKTPVAAGANEMKPLVGYFNNLKARLDAYSERQLDEMDKYQNRTVI
ncbi:MAG TPA: hypothetical protein VIJ05_07590 [Actinomycetes bacterium]